jgi:hypothetical protein
VFALLLAAVHLALVNHFEPFAWLASTEPISGVDFDTHAEQTWRVIEGLDGWGKSWVYDVKLLAGFPNGTLFDADNKLWELWTYGLHRLGFARALGFNSFVFLAHLLLVPWIFLSGRSFGLGTGRALIAATMGSLLWFFDSYAHWFWWIGTVAYIFAAYFYLLPLALFYRFALDRKLWRVPLIALLMALGHLLHPYSFFVMVVPMLAIYLSAFRSFGAREHSAIAAIALTVVLANAYWLIVAIRHWHYILNSAFYGQSHAGFILADFLNLLLDASTTGYIGTRAGFRWMFFVAALGALYLWRRDRDGRFPVFTAGLLWMFILAYVAPVVLPPARQIQPYRFVASAMFLSVFPAAELVGRLWSERATWLRTPLMRIAALLLAVPALQHLAGDVLYFLPIFLPSVPPVREAPFPMTATGFAAQFDYRQFGPGVVDTSVDRWIDQHADEGRIAVPDWTGEHYAWKTRAQILGGFVDLNMSHARAHPMRWVERARPNAAQLRAYIDTYAVRYFVLRFDDFGLPGLPDLVQPEAELGGVSIYRTLGHVSYFAAGSGQVKAGTNRLTVSQTDPKHEIVLKYHWHEALVCKPDCQIERAPVVHDEVGFIRVPAPHPVSFSIENSYDLTAHGS